MNPSPRHAFEQEVVAADQARRAGRTADAFTHLERAHIIGQRHPWRHTRGHLAMLRLGWAQRDWREVAGQLPRILAALVFSRLWVPLGNTGRARVSAFRPMPVPLDLARLLERMRAPQD